MEVDEQTLLKLLRAAERVWLAARSAEDPSKPNLMYISAPAINTLAEAIEEFYRVNPIPQ